MQPNSNKKTIRKILKSGASMWPRSVCEMRGDGNKNLFLKNEIQEPGVYVLYRNGVPYYIGQAGNVGSRIWSHSSNPEGRYYKLWDAFSFFVVSDKKYLDDVEGILIAAMPTANAAQPRIKRFKMPQRIKNQLGEIRHHEAYPLEMKQPRSVPAIKKGKI
jgi:hypothetical protein